MGVVLWCVTIVYTYIQSCISVPPIECVAYSVCFHRVLHACAVFLLGPTTLFTLKEMYYVVITISVTWNVVALLYNTGMITCKKNM